MDIKEIFTGFVGIAGGSALLIGSIAFAYKTWKEGTGNYDDETITSLKNLLEAERQEKEKLRERIVQLESINDGNVKKLEEMMADIAKSKEDIARLEGLNSRAADFTKILESLSQFAPLLGDQGMLAGFKKTDDQLIANQEKIMKHLKIT